LSDPSLDIVLPCYNPQPGWAEEILRAWAAIERLLPGMRLSLILVNDGSRSGLRPEDLALLEQGIPRFRYAGRSENRGKGYTLREGMALSEAPYCIFTDIDFPYTPESLAAVCRRLQEGGADLVAGIKDEVYYQQLPRSRVLVSRLLRALIRLLLRLPISDTQCGLKGFNARGRALFLRTRIERYLADLECIYLGSRTPGFRMEALPVHLREHVVFTPLRLSILAAEGWNFLKLWMRRG
jgi:glycosyltransferase involved in cell wall biosynthesis